jgi:hypothetical protein
VDTWEGGGEERREGGREGGRGREGKRVHTHQCDDVEDHEVEPYQPALAAISSRSKPLLENKVTMVTNDVVM